MQRLTDVVSTKAYLRSRQQHGLRIGLVPTMGALHEGHLSLVRAARTRADIVVASVFVNPKQFGPNEDLDRYPRDLEGDMDKLASVGVDVLFAPTVDAMYPPGFHCTVSVAGPTEGLEGGVRPGHFDGVTTVVLKLFTIVRPDVAVFGEKDYQQLVTLKKMARDLDPRRGGGRRAADPGARRARDVVAQSLSVQRGASASALAIGWPVRRADGVSKWRT